MFGLGITELMLVLVVLLLLFGAKKIPELASGLGQGIRSFKKSLNEDPEAQNSDNIQRIEKTSKTS